MQLNTGLGISFRTRGRRKRERRARLAAAVPAITLTPGTPYIAPVSPFDSAAQTQTAAAPFYPGSATAFAAPYAPSGAAFPGEEGIYPETQPPGLAPFIRAGQAMPVANGEPPTAPNWILPAALAALFLFGGG